MAKHPPAVTATAADLSDCVTISSIVATSENGSLDRARERSAAPMAARSPVDSRAQDDVTSARRRALRRQDPARRHRPVDGTVVRPIEARVLHIAHDPDDGRPRTCRATAFSEALADDVLGREEAPRPRAIDDDGIDRGPAAIAIVEQSAVYQRSARAGGNSPASPTPRAQLAETPRVESVSPPARSC